MLSLIASDHANWLSDDIEVEIFEVVVGREGEVLVDIILITRPESDVYVGFVPPNFLHTLEPGINVLENVDDVVGVWFFRKEKLTGRHVDLC
jgi:hypothetical protein